MKHFLDNPYLINTLENFDNFSDKNLSELLESKPHKDFIISVENISDFDLPKKKLQLFEELLQTRKEMNDHFLTLTKREKEIIQWVTAGLKNPAIADKLFISRCTVEQHRKNIRKKLNYPSDYKLYQFARAFGLLAD